MYAFKKLGVTLGLLAGLALSGCSSVVSGINSVTGALSSPAANQAAANLTAGAIALVCNIQSIASLATVVETGIANGSIATINPNSGLAQTYDITNTVLTVSSAVCTSLKGTVGAQASVTAIANGVATATAVGPTK
jgi:uncharacterized protein YceK